jgi:hypothetical protein
MKAGRVCLKPSRIQRDLSLSLAAMQMPEGAKQEPKTKTGWRL